MQVVVTDPIIKLIDSLFLRLTLQEDHLAVWHRTAADRDAAMRVHDTLRRVLQLPASVPIAYKEHPSLRHDDERE